ncbi:hypothetical protein KUCAC02_008276 [Chaenocephalus aceratus]|uniref:Uncharacterized protein n=1 Tax=Chaenocephalus aceratus TaxID=36190 RepID=A0ACB9XA25_CHAAC|nr:hypothetical protein KUCAC02_008276 [Chaenocephalus aceratus]
MENSAEEYRIQSLDMDTQILEGPGFQQRSRTHLLHHCAGRGQSEQRKRVQEELVEPPAQEFKSREETRARSLQEWVCLVTFICNIFDYLKVNNMPMVALVHPVYDCLIRLSQPDALMNEEEVDCLVLQLHRIGEQLEKVNGPRMNELFYLLRDGFLLQEGLTSMAPEIAD